MSPSRLVVVKRWFFAAMLLVSIYCWTYESRVLAAAASANLAKAKQEAESKGFVFLTNKEEIVAKAKEEGKLEALTFLDGAEKRAMIDAFRKKYPFIQVVAEEIGGTDEYQRFILEMKAGRAKRWDTVHISNQVYAE